MKLMKCIKNRDDFLGFNASGKGFLTVGKEYEIDESQSHSISTFIGADVPGLYVMHWDDGDPGLVPSEFFEDSTGPSAVVYAIKKVQHKCNCATRDLMACGCKCGGV